MACEKPKILLMGLRRGGKSSIRQVVFHNMQPLETLYLESTTKPALESLDSLVQFEVQEVPGTVDLIASGYENRQSIFVGVSSVVYVIDSQDEYLLALQNIVQVIEQAYKVNPKIHFEALIHKVDGLNEDFRQDTQRDIIQRVNDELADVGVNDADLTFYMTSIFDHSIIEAFSRIIQKLVHEFSTLTQLLDIFCMKSGVEKAFLFDHSCKIYLATDSSPVDVETYQVCSDFIDISLDLDALYQFPAGQENEPALVSYAKLQNNQIIFLVQVMKGLLLVGMTRSESDLKRVILQHNAKVFSDSLVKIYV